MPPKKISKPKAPEDPSVRDYYERFRDRLIDMRKDAGLTQSGLSELLGIPLPSYKQMEGKRATHFPLHKLEKLALATRESIEFIVTGKNSRAAGNDGPSRKYLKVVAK